MALAILLTAHSWLRWGVVGLTLLLGARCVLAWRARRHWSADDRSWGVAWVSAVDLQLCIGFALYFVVSPTAAAARHDFRRAWSDDTLRFFGILHPAVMLLALSAAHAGWVWTRRASEAGPERFRRLGLGILAASMLFAMAIPWPFLPYGRPLVRV